MKKLVALMVALTMVLGLASVASAAEYPSKGISVICPWGAGGGTDAVLRAFCEAMGKDLGVTLTVDNRTGGGGIIGHQAIADAEAGNRLDVAGRREGGRLHHRHDHL